MLGFPMAKIDTIDRLREIYGKPSDIAIAKVQTSLDKHCKYFISLSPFVVLSSADANGNADVSPRGDLPGFVKALDDNTLLLPDRPGNRRVDTLSNIIQNPQVGLLFFLPGVKETLRINGTAEIYDDNELLNKCDDTDKSPITVLKITVKQAFLHCAKSIMRSNLWNSEFQIDRSCFPSRSQILADHTSLVKDPRTPQETTELQYAQSIADNG